jgi:hypothetical protein
MGENHKEASGIWWKTEERLQTILRKAVEVCESQSLLDETQLAKWSVSVTEQEVIKGGLAHPNRSICFMRTIDSLLDQKSNLLGSYVNCNGAAVDMKSYELLGSLRKKVVNIFGESNVWRYDVPWSDQGLHEGDETHVAYVKNFAADFKKAIIEKIQNAMDVEPLPHPHTTEVLAHGHMCFTRAKIFRGRDEILQKIGRYIKGEILTDAQDFTEELSDNSVKPDDVEEDDDVEDDADDDLEEYIAQMYLS